MMYEDYIIYWNKKYIEAYRDPKDRLDAQLSNLEWKKKLHPQRVPKQELLIEITKKEIETGTKLKDMEIFKMCTDKHYEINNPQGDII